MGSWKLHWQSWVSTPVGILEAALAVMGQYPCGSWKLHWQSLVSTPVDPGSCTGSQEPVPRKLHWQSRTSAPVGIQEAALAVMGQYPSAMLQEAKHQDTPVSNLKDSSVTFWHFISKTNAATYMHVTEDTDNLTNMESHFFTPGVCPVYVNFILVSSLCKKHTPQNQQLFIGIIHLQAREASH